MAALILVAVSALATVASTLASAAVRDDARDFLAGRISEDDFIRAYSPSALFGVVQFLTFVAAAVVTMILMYRMAANHRTLGRSGTWAPGWAIGGWFLPPVVLYVIPFLMLRELWKASEPELAADDARWREGAVAPAVTAWWVLYGLAPLALFIAQGTSSIGSNVTGGTQAAAEVVVDQFGFSAFGAVLTVLAAAAYLVMMRSLSDRHRRLTGESTR